MATLLKRMFAIALIALCSCNNSDKNSYLIFEELNESLERSNKLIDNSSNSILMSIESKAQAPETAEKAAIWLPIAYSIYNKGKQLIGFIQALKFNLKEDRIKVGQLTSDELYGKIISFKEFALRNDIENRPEYKATVEILNKEVTNKLEFYKLKFSNENTSEIIAILSKLENSTVTVINGLVKFCNDQLSIMRCGIFTKFQPIAIINSTKFERGEELVINAGVGEFKLTGKPLFEINGVKVEPNENGVGEYKMKIKKAPGNYKAHVKIKYTRPDGREDALEKNIEYKVIDSPPNDKQVQVSDTIPNKVGDQ